MATPTFLDAGTDATFGFEFWDALVGSVSSDSGTVATGSRAIQCNATLTSYVEKTASSILGNAGRASVRVYLSGPNTNVTAILWNLGLPLTANFQIRFSSGNTLGIYTGGPTQLAGPGTTLNSGQWYRISVAWNIVSVSNYTIKLFVDGVLDLTATNSPSLDTSVQQYQIGAVGINITSGTISLDDTHTDDGADLSEPGGGVADALRVTAKRAFANGTTNGFTTQIGAGGSGYGSGHAPQVNERPFATGNGWSMIGAGQFVTEEYTIESAATGDVDLTAATIVGLSGWVVASALVNETASLILAGATTAIALTSTITVFTAFVDTASYPGGGTDVGIITDTTLTTVSLYEAGILIEYLPTTLINTSITPPRGMNDGQDMLLP